MGTSVELRLPDGSEPALDLAQRRIADLERRWSRFLPDSEMSVVNRAGGHPTIVSPDTLRLLALSVEAHQRTGGLFDPRTLDALEEAGYDRSREHLVPDTSSLDRGPSSTPTAGSRDPLRADLDHELCAVRLPPGDRWDPGGIGKGLAADLVVTELTTAGVPSVMANLGGDIRVHGPAFGEPCWTVGVDDPFTPGHTLADVHLTGGGVATSSRAKRRWLHDGSRAHHLIDPRTGRPADSGLVAVTVVAASTWWAEVLAKAALIAGPAEGVALIGRAECSALLVDVDGECRAVGGHVHLKEPV